MKIASWNINGLRAVIKSGALFNYLNDIGADIVCLQEIKCLKSELPEEWVNPELNGIKYRGYFYSASKRGYSGVAVWTALEPLEVVYGWPDVNHDETLLSVLNNEGRVLTLIFEGWALINAYFPNSQRDHARLDAKIAFCKKLHQYIDGLKQKGLKTVLCGDTNIAHKEIDLKNPDTNRDNAGFLPQERDWMDRFLKDKKYVDVFRYFYPDLKDHYTWWSYRPGVRQKNIGWRLDYFIVSDSAMSGLIGIKQQDQVLGSDHCPVLLYFSPQKST